VTDDEKFVRSKWSDLELRFAPTYPSVRLSLGGTNVQGWPFKTEEEAWHSSADFTRKRVEEIQDVCDEILAIEKQYKRLTACGVYMNGEPKEVQPLSRTIRRLEEELKELKKGMK
jgi:hypothetical protein